MENEKKNENARINFNYKSDSGIKSLEFSSDIDECFCKSMESR